MSKKSLILGCIVLLGLMIFVRAQERKSPPDKNFFETSLHFTSKGLAHWYAKEQGGLERITGVPFQDLPCAKCHVRTCDACHLQDVDGRLVYTAAKKTLQEACENCHGMESLEAARKTPPDPAADVHFSRGMKCMDCHTAREVHGDGKAYDSFQQPGAMDARCENCHTDLAKCPSSKVHGTRLACNACHVRDLPSCVNCHFDTRVKEGKSVSLPLNNLLFLINRGGQVTLGDIHTFVYQNRTMITFAPSFPHWVMKQGRDCGDCHHTPILQAMKKSTFKPVVFIDGKLQNVAGIIPVREGQKWNFDFLNYENGRWIPIAHPVEPLVNYAGYCAPLTVDQLNKLDKAQDKWKK